MLVGHVVCYWNIRDAQFSVLTCDHSVVIKLAMPVMWLPTEIHFASGDFICWHLIGGPSPIAGVLGRCLYGPFSLAVWY